MSRNGTVRSWIIPLVGLLWVLSVTGCSGKQESEMSAPQGRTETGASSATGQAESPSASSPAEAGAATETEEIPAPAKETSPSSPAAAPGASAASSAPDRPSGAQPPERPQPTRTAAQPAPSAPGKIVAVPATKPGLARIGADKCKVCHKVPYESWAKTAHATKTPLLDCESCHGSGSEYKTLSIMKDPVKARAAGLVIPEKSFCTDNCHHPEWTDDMLERAHARKGDAVQG